MTNLPLFYLYNVIKMINLSQLDCVTQAYKFKQCVAVIVVNVNV